MDWKSYNNERKRRFCNLHLLKDINFANGEMPALEPYTGEVPTDFIPFNRAIKSKDYNKCVHFFIDDYQFERVWNTPERYIPLLKRFKCVIAPDFSVFLDVPDYVNAWNIYRNRLLSQYMQQQGVKIIPNIQVVPDSIKKYAFIGLEGCDLVAISNVQANGYDTRRNWIRFTREMIKQLSPKRLLVYGNKITLSSHKNVTYIDNDNIKRLRLCRTKI